MHSSYNSIREDDGERLISRGEKTEHREWREWITVRNVFYFLAVVVVIFGMCALFLKRNSGSIPIMDKATALAIVPADCDTKPAPATPTCKGVHAWHTVSAFKSNWVGMVSSTLKNVTFVDKDCKEHKNFYQMRVGVDMPNSFGLKFDEDTTFDVGYTVSVIQASPKFNLGFGPGRKCIWVGAVAGPFTPDIRGLPYNGATCMWERVPSVGVNFQVDYWDGEY